jgi:hypothetical protein
MDNLKLTFDAPPELVRGLRINSTVLVSHISNNRQQTKIWNRARARELVVEWLYNNNNGQ